MAGIVSRTAKVIGAGAALTALSWAGYAAATWSRYGTGVNHGREDPLLDRFLPEYEVRERHETRVAAPAATTWAAALDLDLRRSGMVRAIFSGRELLMGARGSGQSRPRRFLDEILALGWRMLAEDPGREIVMGAVTQPWQAHVVFRGLDPDEFPAFDDPGYAKIVWTFRVEPAGMDASVFHTETRVLTTDPVSRERFRRYWSIFSPGILLIRYESLRLIRREAERRAARP
jgi:hypothetical protein